MYDEELAFTGLETFAIGGIVFEAYWLLAVAAVLFLTAVVVARLAFNDANDVSDGNAQSE